MPKTKKYDLKLLLKELVDRQRHLDEIYLFGSRAYRTGSLRSDCDLLLKTSDIGHIKSVDLIEFAEEICPALDFFVAAGGKAVSCANQSFVQALSFPDLVQKLDAELLWSRCGGFSSFEFDPESQWVFETAMVASFPPTVLPSGYLVREAWQDVLCRAETAGLPISPFIGDTLEKAVAQIADVAESMVSAQKDIGKRGRAKDGWTVALESEYDCQNLFWTVVKPWLPKLGRERPIASYERQDKISDFDLFDGKLVVEFKFIDTEDKKREVLKDLDGLSRLYSRGANIRCLLVLIYYKETVSLDARKLQADFTFRSKVPSVITRPIKIP